MSRVVDATKSCRASDTHCRSHGRRDSFLDQHNNHDMPSTIQHLRTISHAVFAAPLRFHTFGSGIALGKTEQPGVSYYMRWQSDLTEALSPHSYSRSTTSPGALEAMSRHGSLRPAHEPKRAITSASLMLLASLMFAPVFLPLQSLAQSNEASSDSEASQSTEVDIPARHVQPPQDEAEKKKLEQKAAEGELHQEEHQHLLGFLPYFNTVNGDTAPPLSPSQKFQLAFKRSITPLTFVGTGLLAGIGQADNNFPKYGQGAEGYGKRFGAQYADTFDGNMIGGAILPVILHQDPRYYRMGTGGLRKRFWYSLSTAVRSKGDDGKWQPGFSPILGSFAAGGIANLYYPPPNRGAGLTFERGSLVLAERALSQMFDEFLPDIQQRFFRGKNPSTASNLQP